MDPLIPRQDDEESVWDPLSMQVGAIAQLTEHEERELPPPRFPFGFQA